MSDQMTITRVMEGDQWSNDFGTNQSYTLDLELTDGSVVQDIVSNRKIKDDGSHKEPQEQEVVWGDLLPMKGNQRKLKLDYDAMKENGSSPSHSGGSESKTSNNSGGRDIDASIAWQVALKVLAPTINLRLQENKSIFTNDVMDAVISLQNSIIAAGHPDVKEPDIDLSGARTEEPGQPDDTHSWIENLLVVAGCPTYPAGKLATYAVTKLKPDQLKTLESELNDEDDTRKQAGRKRVEASYENTEALPVPQVDPLDDDIPF